MSRNRRHVHLEPRVMDLLVHLARHPAQVRSKEEILAAVWEESFIEEGAVARCVSDLRKALGDTARTPRYIQTIAKRGYRLIAPVSCGAGADRPRGRWFILTLAAIGLALSALIPAAMRYGSSARTAARSLAVLPFANVGGDPETEYFAIGITEDLLTRLSEVGDLRVVARDSAFRYLGSEKNRAEIGRELGVGAVVEGSVRRRGNQVRIACRLINAASEEQIWARTYDRRLGDVFTVQSEVTREITAALHAHLTAGERASLDHRPTDDPDAYDYLLRGRGAYRRYDPDGYEDAIVLFRRAIELDPGFALAHAWLANAYALKAADRGRGADPEVAELALAAAQRALALDPDLPEAHKALGTVHATRGSDARALEHYRRALEVRPDYDDVLNNVAVIELNHGAFGEALRLMRTQVETDPAALRTLANYAYGLGVLGFDAEARELLARALAVEPYHVQAQQQLATFEIEAGDLGAARRRLRRLQEVHPGSCRLLLADVELRLGEPAVAERLYTERLEESGGRDVLARFRLGEIDWRYGERERAETLWAEAEAAVRRAIGDGDERWSSRWILAAIASLRGDREGAVHWYGKAVAAGRRNYRWDLADPVFAPLRTDPRFQAVIAGVRADLETQRRGVEEEGLWRPPGAPARGRG